MQHKMRAQILVFTIALEIPDVGRIEGGRLSTHGPTVEHFSNALGYSFVGELNPSIDKRLFLVATPCLALC
jgi:hypothetical protein